MRAAFLADFDPDAPARAVSVGERPEPVAHDGWEVVEVKAASLNRHDLLTACGAGFVRANQLPMILGCDAAGVDSDGNEVIVHPVVNGVGWEGPELLDPHLSLLSDRHPGTFAERVAVPRRNLVPKPPGLSFAEAACLPTAWLTAYRMLFTQAAVRPGDTILVQGASGGLSTALTALARSAGVRVWVTGRTEATRAYAIEHGADAAFEPGARLPERVDAVMDSVGPATWMHSLKALRRGGVLVVSGATTGREAPIDVTLMFSHSLRIVASVMGTRDELRRLVAHCTLADLHPPVSRVLGLGDAGDALSTMQAGDVRGKIVLCP
jgi:NADPH:quinone reductase-like Zn-dependent oxidoreductase